MTERSSVRPYNYWLERLGRDRHSWGRFRDIAIRAGGDLRKMAASPGAKKRHRSPRQGRLMGTKTADFSDRQDACRFRRTR